MPGDLRDPGYCRRLVAEAMRGLGGLDILVNNAGRQQSHASILDISEDQFDWTMKTNIYAPFWIIKAALPHMPPGSAIIGTASEQAYDPSADLYDYAQTKAATMNYVKSLGKAARRTRHPRQRRRARPDLDRAAGQRRSAPGQGDELRRRRPARAARASRRNWPRSTSSSPPTTPATPPVKSTARAAARGSLRGEGPQASEGSICLQAAIRPRTELTDLANIARSSSSSGNSMMRSAPPAPITVGAPA